MNKLVVKVKLSKFGYVGLIVFGPIFLSIPLGSIVVAKFFRDDKKTYWLAMINIVAWGFMLSGIGYLFKVVF